MSTNIFNQSNILITINVNKSKTDQMREGNIIYISETNSLGQLLTTT